MNASLKLSPRITRILGSIGNAAVAVNGRYSLVQLRRIDAQRVSTFMVPIQTFWQDYDSEAWEPALDDLIALEREAILSIAPADEVVPSNINAIRRKLLNSTSQDERQDYLDFLLTLSAKHNALGQIREGADILEEVRSVDPQNWHVLADLGKNLGVLAESTWMETGDRKPFKRVLKIFEQARQALPAYKESFDVEDQEIAEFETFERNHRAFYAYVEANPTTSADTRGLIHQSLARFFNSKKIDAAHYQALLEDLMQNGAPMETIALIFTHAADSEPTISHMSLGSREEMPLRLFSAVRRLAQTHALIQIVEDFEKAQTGIGQTVAAIHTFHSIDHILNERGLAGQDVARAKVRIVSDYLTAEAKAALSRHVDSRVDKFERDKLEEERSRALAEYQNRMAELIPKIFEGEVPVVEAIDGLIAMLADVYDSASAEYKEIERRFLLGLVPMMIAEVQDAHFAVLLADELMRRDEYFAEHYPPIFESMLRGKARIERAHDGKVQTLDIGLLARATFTEMLKSIANDVFRAVQAIPEGNYSALANGSDLVPGTEKEFSLLERAFNFFFVGMRNVPQVAEIFQRIELPYAEPISLRSYYYVFLGVNAPKRNQRIALFEKAIEADENNIVARVELAREYSENGDQAKYQAARQDVLDKKDTPLVRMRLAEVEMTRLRKKAQELASDNRNVAGIERQAFDLLSSMEPLYAQALEDYPGQVFVQDDWYDMVTDMGAILILQGKVREASRLYTHHANGRILSANDEYVVQLYGHAIEEMSEINQYREAMVFVDFALQQEPGNPNLVATKINLFRLMGREGASALESVDITSRIAQENAITAGLGVMPEASKISTDVFSEVFGEDGRVDGKALLRAANQIRSQKLDPEIELSRIIGRLVGFGRVKDALVLYYNWITNRSMPKEVQPKDQEEFIMEALHYCGGLHHIRAELKRIKVLFDAKREADITETQIEIWDTAVRLGRAGVVAMAAPIQEALAGRPMLYRAAALSEKLGEEGPEKDRELLQTMKLNDPEHFFPVKHLADQQMRAGRFRDAKEILENALRDGTASTPGEKLAAHSLLVDVYYKLSMADGNKFDKRKKLILQAVEEARKVIKIATSEERSAIEAELTVELYLHHALAHGFLAVFFSTSSTTIIKGDRHYQQAIEAAQNDVNILIRIPVQLSGVDAYNNGEAALRRLLKIDPNHIEAMLKLCDCLMKQNKIEEAYDLIARIVGIDPLHPSASIDYGAKLLTPQSAREALAYYQDLVQRLEALDEIDEEHRITHYLAVLNLGGSNFMLERKPGPEDDIRILKEQAAIHYARAAELAREYNLGNHKIQEALIGQAQELEDVEEARAITVKALELGPHPLSINFLSRSYLGEGNLPEAIKYLRQLNQHHSDSEMVLELLCDFGDAGEEAWAAAEKFLKGLNTSKGVLSPDIRRKWLRETDSDIPAKLKAFLTALDPKPQATPAAAVDLAAIMKQQLQGGGPAQLDALLRGGADPLNPFGQPSDLLGRIAPDPLAALMPSRNIAASKPAQPATTTKAKTKKKKLKRPKRR